MLDQGLFWRRAPPNKQQGRKSAVLLYDVSPQNEQWLTKFCKPLSGTEQLPEENLINGCNGYSRRWGPLAAWGGRLPSLEFFVASRSLAWERGGKHYSLRQPAMPGKSRLARVGAGFYQQLYNNNNIILLSN